MSNYISLLGNGVAIKSIVEALAYGKQEREKRSAQALEGMAKAAKEFEAAYRSRLQNIGTLIALLKKAGFPDSEIQRRVQEEFASLDEARRALSNLQEMVESKRIRKIEAAGALGDDPSPGSALD